MKNFLRGLGFLAISLIVGEVIKRLLTSRVGEAAAGKLGHPEFATLEGAASVSKEAKRAVGLVKTLTGPKPKVVEPAVVEDRQPGWVGLARDASEMLLAAGALLKVASDFVGEDRKLRKRITRTRVQSS
jgi:hypothetical protein